MGYQNDVIQVGSSKIADHRAITQMLDEGNNEYHTFELPEDKTLKAMFRGIPELLPTNEIKYNLMKIEFAMIIVAKMHKKFEGTYQQNSNKEYFQTSQARIHADQRTPEGQKTCKMRSATERQSRQEVT